MTKEERLASKKAYRLRNVEKIKAYRANYRKHQSEQIKAYERKWRKKNSLYRKQWKKEYRKRVVKEISKSWKIYYRVHSERLKRLAKIYRKANPMVKRVSELKRRAARSRVFGVVTEADIKEHLSVQSGRCYWCCCLLNRGFHVDHLVPLSKGGPHAGSNVRPVCVHCNSSKWASLPMDFALELLS